MAQIICNNVSLGYEDRRVCENLNFEINAGDYLCIVGDNGSGKSTLMKALLSFGTVLEGEITFSDQLILQSSRKWALFVYKTVLSRSAE